MEQVKLIGAWPSPFCYRVIWALKLKGIPYEYIEENLYNKIPLLLQHNPISKKIPVLVHGGKSICESMVILEYMEETWLQNPLLPSDPYERAVARFWIKFAEDQGLVMLTLFRTMGEEQEKAKKGSLESLRTLEEHGLGEKKFFSGDEISLVDIAFGGVAHWMGVLEDVVGVKLLTANMFPCLHAWTKNLKNVAVIKENLPNRDEMVKIFKHQREMLLASE